MKKLIIFLAFNFVVTIALACDICGCGVGNNYIGILPDYNKQIVGLRYRYNSLLSHVGVGGTLSYLTTSEKYQTLEVWGGWTFGSKFRVMASIPYSFNERLNQGFAKNKQGLGDINVLGYYQLVNSRKPLGEKLLVQSLWAGIGVKAPTGKYNPVDKLNSNNNANLFQLGTGSTDFTLNAMYDIRLQDAGINTTGSYKINTANNQRYKYGDKVSFNAQAYYKIRIKNMVTIAPNVGIALEKGKKDSDVGFEVDISGGGLTMVTLGTEATYKKISVGWNWQKPLSQDLANGIIQAKTRGMVHLSFVL